MNISADKSKLEGNRSGLFLALLQIIWGSIGGLIGFFTLTEKERLEAGVIVGNKWRDG